jgi:hypothetical protein
MLWKTIDKKLGNIQNKGEIGGFLFKKILSKLGAKALIGCTLLVVGFIVLLLSFINGMRKHE